LVAFSVNRDGRKDIQTKNAMNFSQDICNYTKDGRIKLHQNLKIDGDYIKVLPIAITQMNDYIYNYFLLITFNYI
jgi:hypothetical protein